MAITVTTTPQYAVVAKPPKLTFSVNDSLGKRVRLFVTDAPVGSKYKKQLTDTGASQVRIHDGDIGQAFQFEADLPGAYTLLAQEIQIPQFGGGYKGDTRGHLDVGGGKGAEKVLSEDTATVYIGQRLTGTLGAGEHKATLVLWVWQNTIRTTSVELHGEASPDIIDPSSPVAKTAAGDTTVRAKLHLIENQDVATVLYNGTDFPTMLDDLIVRLNSHFSNASVHAAADSANLISSAFSGSEGKAGIPLALAKIFDALDKHLQTDAANAMTIGFGAAGRGTGDWHINSGHTVADGNALLASAPREVGDCWVAFADIVRVATAHWPKLSLHNLPDVFTVSLSRYLQLHRVFLDVIAGMSPTPAPDENPGATLLVHDAGLELS